MRHNTLKRQKLNRAASKVREQLIAEVGFCELCNRNFSLCVHEIARGLSRWKAQDTRFATLVLCNAPHGDRQSCHGVVQPWDRAKQLALLYLRRPGDYSLESFWKITGRRWPEQCDVDGWVQVLIGQGDKS